MGQLQPSTRVLRPEPLPSVKEAGFLSRKLLLFQVAFIGRQVVAFRSSHRKEIATFVFFLEPLQSDLGALGPDRSDAPARWAS